MEIREMMGRINELASGFRGSMILFAAVEADVFRLLEQERTSDEVAAALGWDGRGARVFLDALVALELVEKSHGRYRNAPVASQCLVPGAPAYQGNIVRHIRTCMEMWGGLSDVVRTGIGGFQQQGRSPQEIRNFILGMADIGKFSAQEILGLVDLSPYRHALDLAGGPAAYSIAFLKAHPGMRATLFDLPEVIPIALEQVRNAGIEDRFQFIAGDLRTDDIGRGYDVILVSNIIHSFGPDTNRKLVSKCYDCMIPGGLLIIKDFLTNDDRTGPPFCLLFALHMFLAAEEGDTHSTADVQGWTKAAGFVDGRALDIAANSRLWLARKPPE